jgi:pimeloyl-ACP methyl ester carboxylesterase
MSRSVQHSLAVWPQRESGLGMRSALTETARFARLSAFRNRPVPLPGGLPHVVPGFLTSDMTTARLRRSLDALGYRAEGWRGGPNLGPRTKAIDNLKERVAALADATGGKIAVAGVSLGGVFAREIAKMMPDKVGAVVTLCSPVRLPVPTPLAPFVWALQRWFDDDLVAAASGEPVMPTQPMLAVYSRDDGIVQWQACVPPPGENVRAIDLPGAGHTTIGSNPMAQALVAQFLADALP